MAMASSVASSMDCELLRMGSPWPWQLHSNESYESCDSHVIHRAKMNIDEQSASKCIEVNRSDVDDLTISGSYRFM